MNKQNELTEAQEKWLAALESGEYRQAQEWLWQDSDLGKGYCCLGVACMVAGFEDDDLMLDAWIDEEEPSGHSAGEFAPELLVNHLGLRASNGDFSNGESELKGQQSLADANDHGATFAEIAAFIRDNPWDVFTNFDSPKEATT